MTEQIDLKKFQEDYRASLMTKGSEDVSTVSGEMIQGEEKIDRLAFGVYRGQDFMKFEFAPKEFLIDGLVNRLDSVFLVGSPKSGKSLFVKQMICSLTSGHPFLEKYEISRPSTVLYVQLEGEAQETKDRFQRMCSKVELDSSKLTMFYSDPMRLETEEGLIDFYRAVDIASQHYDVIVIDGLYLSFNGSLSDDEAVRKVLGNLRRIKNRYHSTMIVVHHTHKTKLNQDGEVIMEGDEAIFGSQFLRAWPDHIMMITHDKKSDLRHLRCSTQRSGSIEKEIKMKLIQPDPLYFETMDEIPAGIVYDNAKVNILKFVSGSSPQSARATEIINGLEIPKSTFFFVIKELIRDKKIYKDGKGKGTLYRCL
jgi:predicted ATP-dependent serine protease